MAIGSAIGAAASAKMIEPRFLRWCQKEEGLKFLAQLAPFVKNEGSLAKFVCPITQMVLIDAVKTPNGRLYEKYAIEDWVQKNGTDPLTREKLSLKDLKPDHSSSFDSNKIFLEVIRNKMPEIKEKAPELLENIECMVKDIRESAMDQYNSRLILLQTDYKEGRIDYEAFQKLSAKLSEKYFNI